MGDLKRAESLTAEKVSDFRHLSSRNDGLAGEVLSTKTQSRELTTRHDVLQEEVLAMRKQSRELSTRTNNVTTENDKLKAEMRDMKDFVSRTERHIEKISRCRHCEEGFGAKLEVNARYNGFIVRCGYCSTKH